MRKWGARLAAVVAGAIALGAGACSLLPERFAVNAPLGHMLFGSGVAALPEDELRQRLTVPDGLSVSLYADGLPNARFLRLTEVGDLLVSQPRRGRITLLRRDRDRDGRPDARSVVLEGLDRPHGLDLHDGWLYVGETGAVGRARFDAATGLVQGGFERVVTGLPAGGNHWTRTVRFGPDGWMYVAIGSSCNVCIEDDPRRASVVRYRPDGSSEEIYARGLRNSVGFDWHPVSGALYATDNGRDLLGDDVPPCELNQLVRGGFYGWPFANGDRVPDPDLGKGRRAKINASIPPVHGFRAHTAPLGITFVRHPDAPAWLRGAALVALHGSWNRTEKDGYEVVSLHWDAEGRIAERPFLTGFERDGNVIGRPVDVAEGPDGEWFVSDDFAGAIYRVAAGTGRSAIAHAATGRATRDPLAALAPAIRRDRARTGRVLYERHDCASCHEPERAAAGVVPVPLEQLAARYDVAALAAFLAAPTPPMPAFPLSDPERADLAVYLLDAED